MGPGRADKAGPLLAQDTEEASARNGRAQSSVRTFFETEEVEMIIAWEAMILSHGRVT